MSGEGQGELWEELKVENLWFHVLNAMIHRGKIREMGANAWVVYCILKAHVKLDTGASYPSITRIAELSGFSHDTVQRAMKKLLEMEIVAVEKRGRSNHYELKESVPMVRQDGEIWGLGERQYVPKKFKPFIDELQKFAEHGITPTDQKITINVTFNVQNITQGDGGSVTMNVQNVQVENAERRQLPSDDLFRKLKGITGE